MQRATEEAKLAACLKGRGGEVQGSARPTSPSEERACTEQARAVAEDASATAKVLELATRWAETANEDALARVLKCRVMSTLPATETLKACGAPALPAKHSGASSPPTTPQESPSPSNALTSAAPASPASAPEKSDGFAPPVSPSTTTAEAPTGSVTSSAGAGAASSGFQLDGRLVGGPSLTGPATVGVGVQLGYTWGGGTLSLAPTFATTSVNGVSASLLSVAVTPRFYFAGPGKLARPYLRPEAGFDVGVAGEVTAARFILAAAGGVEVMLNPHLGLSCELGLGARFGDAAPLVSTSGAVGVVLRP